MTAYASMEERLLALRSTYLRYDPSEPRVPAGDPNGGEWTDGGGGGPALVHAAVNAMSGDFDVPKDAVKVVEEDGRKFKVGDREFTEAGHYNPATKTIQINASYLHSEQEAHAIVAHEMTHHAWHEVREAQSAERAGVKALFDGPESATFYKRNGYLRPEMAEEFGKRFPATRLLGRYGMDPYGQSDEGDHGFEELRKWDGVTDYSEAYWHAKDATPDTQVNETLAEISAIRHSPHARTREVRKIWRDLHRDVLKHAREH